MARKLKYKGNSKRKSGQKRGDHPRDQERKDSFSQRRKHKNRGKDFSRSDSRDEITDEELLGIPPKKILAFLEDSYRRTQSQLDGWLEESRQLLHAQKKESPAKTLLETLDPWQRNVYDALESGKNVVVDAPTTAGKTRAVEAFFHLNIDKPDFRAAYTTPVKSLSNDKVRELRAMFGRDRVGIATGDLKENLSAPIVVTTLETYRNSLLGVEPDLNRSLVVYDEYHFMQDESRGSAWEEAIILTPQSCQLLLLSASVSNAEEFVAWLEKIHNRKTILIRTEHRPVPLVSLVFIKDRWILTSELPEFALHPRKRNKEVFPIPLRVLGPRMSYLIDMRLTPCIVYAGRRKSVENVAFELSRHLPMLPEKNRYEIGTYLQKEHEESKVLNFFDPNMRNLIQNYGVAYHHSGMAPAARVAIEGLLKNGMLRFCSATMGLSIGINFSVRSALISDLQRPGERGMSKYTPSEVLQMLGRAGRRGRDAVGFSLWPSLEAYQLFIGAKRDRCDSRLRNDPTTFLSLVGQGRNAKEIETFYSRSFMRFRDTGIDLGLLRRNRLEQKLGQKDLPCISPAHEYAYFYDEQRQHKSKCGSCPYRTPCHRYIQAKVQNDLAALQLHLHNVDALDDRDNLTPYGELAKYLPQTGGLIVSRYIHEKIVDEENLAACAELMASMTLARHKSPNIDQRFRFPFDANKIEEALEHYYPIHLFPELYDLPFGRRTHPVIREFNPAGAYPIRLWIQGCTWKELAAKTTSEKFAEGDLISLVYRVASYMQSLAQAHHGSISKLAGTLRESILREPISLSL